MPTLPDASHDQETCTWCTRGPKKPAILQLLRGGMLPPEIAPIVGANQNHVWNLLQEAEERGCLPGPEKKCPACKKPNSRGGYCRRGPCQRKRKDATASRKVEAQRLGMKDLPRVTPRRRALGLTHIGAFHPDPPPRKPSFALGSTFLHTDGPVRYAAWVPSTERQNPRMAAA